MKHPFSQLFELTQQQVANTSGGFTAEYRDDLPRNAVKPGPKRPGVATTMAIGEEGGSLPGGDWY